MTTKNPLPSGPTGAGPEAVEAPIPVEVVYTAPEAPWWIEHCPTEEEAWWVEIEVEEELPWTVEEV